MAGKSPKKSRAASPAATEDGFVRLHISPFDADLLKIVVPASALPSARNISYHTIETFPERRYGFVELPQMDAEKIKKKLNGTVLKGGKVRIEKARPEKRIEPDSADEDDKSSKKNKSKKEGDDAERPKKKRKREMGVVDGVMLDDRKVKRGWTEPADYKNKKKSRESAKEAKTSDKDQKRKQPRSKYIEKEECLLKTRMPPNEMGNLPNKEDTSVKKKKKKNSSRQVTVHEFEKTTKFMSFLRSSEPESNGKKATEFVEGKGWVDEDGNVVETLKEKEKPKPQPKKSLKRKQAAPVESDSESTSSSDTSSDETSSEEESDEDEDAEAKQPAQKAKSETKKAVIAKEDQDSDSETSESDSDSSEDESSDEESETPTPDADDDGTSKSLSIDIPPPPTTPKAVHPLEALYKPSKADGVTTPGVEKKTGFSFFGADIEEEEDDGAGTGLPAVPMTPYTKQDFEWRNVRSAAPTPDTVHPARMRSFFPPADEDTEMAEVEEEDEEGYGEDGADEDAAAAGQQATSDFQKWFWENRRDLNRSWMTRRKTAAKEKRHRDNKARASKAV